MQSLKSGEGSSNTSVLRALRNLTRLEGAGASVRGMSMVAMGAGPAHALYFATYEKCKLAFAPTHQIPGTSPSPFVAAGAAVVATLVHDTFMNPFDVIKQRLQMEGSPFKRARDCFKHIYRTEGPSAFYRSLSTQIAMNIPFQTCHFVAYEYFCSVLNPSGRYDPFSHVVAGAGAGAIAAAITTPLDVVKTLLNTQEVTAVSSSGNNSNIQSAASATASASASASSSAQNFTGQSSTSTRAIHTATPSSLASQVSTAASSSSIGASAATTSSSASQASRLVSQLQVFPLAHAHAGASGAGLPLLHSQLHTSGVASSTSSAVPPVVADRSVNVKGVSEAIRTIYATHGLKGFLMGLRPRVIFQMPSTAVSWLVYEFFKHSLSSDPMTEPNLTT
ncbi:carrier protein, variant [Capsaspora owczarzaki ATCC 30864]|nr:carrier protein, variant [Capsaspora owczarzaki ATCC 30864]